MICKNCGATFDENDAIHYTEDYGETFMGCPVCGASDIADAATCSECGRELDIDDVQSGLCIDCMWDTITYDIALAYIEETDSLIEFFLGEWLHCGAVKIENTQDLAEFLRKAFKNEAENDRLFTEKHYFLEACRSWCLPCYLSSHCWLGGGEDFAEWYDTYRKEKLYGEPD